MKKLLTVLMVTALCGVAAQAQYSSLKDKARGLDDKINARHNAAENGAPPPGLPPKNPPPGTPPPPAAAQPVLAAPVKPSTQQQAATKLKADIVAARAKGSVSEDDKKQFVQNLQLAVMGRGHPTAETLAQFTEDFLPVITAKNVTPANDSRIVEKLVISLNCAGLSETRTHEIGGELEAAMTKSGASTEAAGKVGTRLAQIVSEVQAGANK